METTVSLATPPEALLDSGIVTAPPWGQLQLHTDPRFLLILPVEYCPAAP